MTPHPSSLPRPPRFARLLLRLRRLGRRREDVEADLGELFRVRTTTWGRRRATRRYWLDVLSLWRRPIRAEPPASPHITPRGVGADRWWTPIGLLSDLRFSLRLLRKRPWTTALATIGLGLAMAICTLAFSLLNASELKPTGVEDPDGVFALILSGSRAPAPALDYRDIEHLRATTTRSRVEAYLHDAATVGVTDGLDDAPAQRVQFVTAGFFDMLGGRTSIGRPLAAADARPGAPPVAVLAQTTWLRQFDRAPDVLGRTIHVAGAPFTIVGVARPEFTGPARYSTPALWIPIEQARFVHEYLDIGLPRWSQQARLVVRPNTNVSPAQALEELRGRILPLLSGAADDVRVTLDDIGNRMSASDLAIVVVVGAIFALVLLLAAANVANLQLAAASTRGHEIGTRLAIGASRGRLVRQMLIESLLVSGAAGLLGLLALGWGTPLVYWILRGLPRLPIDADWRVLLFAGLVSLYVGVVTAVAPARFALTATAAGPLRRPDSGSRSATGNGRARSALVSAQAAASLVLLVLTALLTRSLVTATRLDVGFDVDQTLIVMPGVRGFGTDPGRMAARWPEIVERINAVPGVESTAFSQYPPFGSSWAPHILEINGESRTLLRDRTSSGFFATAGISFTEGRAY